MVAESKPMNGDNPNSVGQTFRPVRNKMREFPKG
jgi:hypothetical protein